MEDAFDSFIKRMNRRADHLEQSVNRMVVSAFVGISDFIFAYNPVWSSQSVVNWTASIGHSPKVRLVNVDRSNTTIKRGKLVDRGEGDKTNITVHKQAAQAARFVAANTARDVAANYKPLPGRQKPPALWLTNRISYTPKLWAGDWPSNPRTLQEAIDNGLLAARRIKVWKF